MNVLVTGSNRGLGLELHPGGVTTRMGPREGLTPVDSVRGLRRQVAAFDLAHTGRFVRFDGTEMPW